MSLSEKKKGSLKVASNSVLRKHLQCTIEWQVKQRKPDIQEKEVGNDVPIDEAIDRPMVTIPRFIDYDQPIKTEFVTFQKCHLWEAHPWREPPEELHKPPENLITGGIDEVGADFIKFILNFLLDQHPNTTYYDASFALIYRYTTGVLFKKHMVTEAHHRVQKWFRDDAEHKRISNDPDRLLPYHIDEIESAIMDFKFMYQPPIIDRCPPEVRSRDGLRTKFWVSQAYIEHVKKGGMPEDGLGILAKVLIEILDKDLIGGIPDDFVEYGEETSLLNMTTHYKEITQIRMDSWKMTAAKKEREAEEKRLEEAEGEGDFKKKRRYTPKIKSKKGQKGAEWEPKCRGRDITYVETRNWVRDRSPVEETVIVVQEPHEQELNYQDVDPDPKCLMEYFEEKGIYTSKKSKERKKYHSAHPGSTDPNQCKPDDSEIRLIKNSVIPVRNLKTMRAKKKAKEEAKRLESTNPYTKNTDEKRSQPTYQKPTPELPKVMKHTSVNNSFGNMFSAHPQAAQPDSMYCGGPSNYHSTAGSVSNSDDTTFQQQNLRNPDHSSSSGPNPKIQVVDVTDSGDESHPPKPSQPTPRLNWGVTSTGIDLKREREKAKQLSIPEAQVTMDIRKEEDEDDYEELYEMQNTSEAKRRKINVDATSTGRGLEREREEPQKLSKAQVIDITDSDEELYSSKHSQPTPRLNWGATPIGIDMKRKREEPNQLSIPEIQVTMESRKEEGEDNYGVAEEPYEMGQVSAAKRTKTM